MDRKRVFISYSHDSEVSPAHRQRVLGLSERLRADGIETILDQYLNGTPKQGWPRWMLDELDAADRVLVVCTETYYRRFRGHEEPGKGKGVDWEGGLITQEIYDTRSQTTKFIPVLFDPKDEPFIPEPLRGHNWYLVSAKAGYDALYDALLDQVGVQPGAIGPLKPRERPRGEPLRFEQAGEDEARRIHPTRLHRMPARLFGREEELARLDAAWTDSQTHVVTLVAWGGEGKTALTGKWAARLAARDYDGARYFDWSFYSQGTGEDRMASSDSFLAAALRFFGDPGMADSPTAPEEKGRRVAELVARERTLLLLDGLEPLQYPPGPLGGEFKDPGIKALLRSLAQRNPGLCLLTTRESVTDLAGFRETTAPEWKLESLTKKAGIELLKSLGVHGIEKDLESLVEDVDGHALTLNLVGSYLSKAHGGDVRKRDRVDLQKADNAVQGGHAFKTMAAYERWLGEGGEDGARQLAILRLMGLFDRPADPGCLAALRKTPAIPGLTEPLFAKPKGWRNWFKAPQPLNDQEWNLSCSALRDGHLLAPVLLSEAHDRTSAAGVTLDAHPLLREHFARRLREEQPETWRAAHGRLYEHLRDSTERRPATLEGLQPLYQAVAHGCQAGRQQKACDEVYWDRISRRQDAYAVKKLGAYGADLGAVASFFEPPWSRASPALTEADQAWLLNQAALRLRALGRLAETLEPMRVAIGMAESKQDWRNASAGANNLSELEVVLGEISTAVRNAEQAVNFADRSGDAFMRMAFRTTQADALHQAGRRTEALELFHEAERMQAESRAEYPLLYSLQGFQYCDLLLTEAERAAWRSGAEAAEAAEAETLSRVALEVEERAAKVLKISERNLWLLDIALDHLTLSRVRLYRKLLRGAELESASSEIEPAVNGLRRAGTLEFLIRGLLTRAWLRALQGNPSGAEADLAEAQEIAERGPMPLHLADVHLHRARLFRDRAALASARALIEKHGYWRRKEELEDAEAASLGWPA